MLIIRSIQAYSNADILTPLVRRMISKDPNLRPGASEALREWKAIRRRVSSIQRYWRLRPVKESWLATVYFEFKASVSLLYPSRPSCVSSDTIIRRS